MKFAQYAGKTLISLATAAFHVLSATLISLSMEQTQTFDLTLTWHISDLGQECQAIQVLSCLLTQLAHCFDFGTKLSLIHVTTALLLLPPLVFPYFIP